MVLFYPQIINQIGAKDIRVCERSINFATPTIYHNDVVLLLLVWKTNSWLTYTTKHILIIKKAYEYITWRSKFIYNDKEYMGERVLIRVVILITPYS